MLQGIRFLFNKVALFLKYAITCSILKKEHKIKYLSLCKINFEDQIKFIQLGSGD